MPAKKLMIKNVKEKNRVTIVMICGTAIALACVLADDSVLTNRTPDLSGLLVSEAIENGALIQELKSADELNPSKRRIGLVDESWFNRKVGLTASHHINVIGTGLILSEFDMNSDGRIDLVKLRLVDGRRLEVIDKDFDGKFEITNVSDAK